MKINGLTINLKGMNIGLLFILRYYGKEIIKLNELLLQNLLSYVII